MCSSETTQGSKPLAPVVIAEVAVLLRTLMSILKSSGKVKRAWNMELKLMNKICKQRAVPTESCHQNSSSAPTLGALAQQRGTGILSKHLRDM